MSYIYRARLESNLLKGGYSTTSPENQGLLSKTVEASQTERLLHLT